MPPGGDPVIGKCPLCLQVKELVKSHLLPKSLYKRLLGKANRNPSPLVFSSTDEHQTSRQAWRHLLCYDCEQRFHEEGESWTLDHCARDASTFKLRELMLCHTGYPISEDWYIYHSASIPEINTGALTYFALSVIWRAAVCSWSIDGHSVTQISLGPYLEAFRSYLSGMEGVPQNTAVWLCVSSLQEVRLICTFPETRNWGGYRSHFFTIPGLTFTIEVGQRMPRCVTDACIHGAAGRPLFYSAIADLANFRDFARLAALRNAGSRAPRFS